MQTSPTVALSQQLLLSVTEQLKLPLLQISRAAERAELTGELDLQSVRVGADSALKLLDNYALGVRLSVEQAHLAPEPVSVSAVLYDSGQDLYQMAKAYGVDLELNISGRFGPVMANRLGLQAALTSLGAALIEALPGLDTPQLKLQLATHRCRYGIVAGVYAETERLNNELLKRGRALQGRARQPLSGLTGSSGAGIFVADALFEAMNLRLGVSRHHHLHGLGAVLQTTNQLQLV